MSASKITLNSSYFSRFYFHYEVELSFSESSSILELSLDSLLEPEKRNVIKYEFSEVGSRTINDKIPLTGLKEGDFVFALCLFDLSLKRILAACSYPVQLLLEKDSMMEYLFDYEILSLSISEQKGVACKALIKNLGSISWGEDSLPASISFILKSCNDNSEESIESNSQSSLIIPSGSLEEISLNSLNLPLVKGTYFFCIELRVDDLVVSCAHNVELKRIYLSGAKDLDKTKIELQESNLRQNKYITLKGRVENLGDSDWYMGLDVINPFLLGAVVVVASEKGEERIGEFRFHSDHVSCRAGEAFDFNFAFELKEKISHPITVRVAMLREGCYWLQDSKDGPCEVSFIVSGNEPVEIKEEESFFKKKVVQTVLVIAPSLPLYDREAGGLRMLELLKLFLEEESLVYFYYESAGISGDVSSYLSALTDLGVCIVKDLQVLNADTGIKPDMVFISTWNCIERYVDSLRNRYPEAIFVGDMIDLHWKREGRAIEQGLSQMSLGTWQDLKVREKKAYRSCDLSVVVTEDDRLSLLEEEPNIRILVLSTIHKLREVSFNQKAVDDPKALFIGHFRHVPNVSSCLQAIAIIKKYNDLREKQVILNIIGDNAPVEILRSHDGESIFVRGYVPDIRNYEEQSSFLLAPIKFGAGIKGKICEAISAGIPVLTNKIGNEGIGLEHKKEAFIAEEMPEFIEGVDFILENYERSRSLVSASRKKLEKLFSVKAQKPIVNNLFSQKKVTISIVTFNQAGLLEKCLSSIFALTNYSNFDVFVYSNACTDSSPDVLSRYKDLYEDKFNFHIADKNDYFVRPNNYVINKCGDNDILLLNNDVEIIEPYWLDELNFAAYMAPWIGAAGCMVLDSVGKISEAGAKMNLDGVGANLGRGDSPDNPAHNQVKYVDYVSGCCLYMKRSSVDLIGALDEDFHPMYYEDSAWQFKLRNEGYKTIYTPRTRIVHKEGSSAGIDISEGMKKFQVINREKFKKKFNPNLIP